MTQSKTDAQLGYCPLTVGGGLMNMVWKTNVTLSKIKTVFVMLTPHPDFFLPALATYMCMIWYEKVER